MEGALLSRLDHSQMAELYIVRAELEGLAANLAAKHATSEEIKVLQDMVDSDRKIISDPSSLARSNRRFHKQIHLASHNRFLIKQLDLVHRSMALMATTSLAADGRGAVAVEEHQAIVTAIANGDSTEASEKLRDHISVAFITRLKQDSLKID